MNFKLWFENQENNQEEIKQPYYRITNGLIGSGGENGQNKLGPGTYWTPRWDSIIMMMQTTMKYYFQENSLKRSKDFWNTTVYQINHAIMQNAPEDHKWAHNFTVDAGEKILTKALEQPTIVTKFDVKLENIHPTDNIFQKLTMETKIEKPVNLQNAAEATLNDQNVFLMVNYNNYNIEIYQINPKQYWKPKLIGLINSYKQYEELIKTKKLTYKHIDSNQVDSIEWFVMDMDKDARHGKKQAIAWLQPGYEFGQHQDEN